MRAKFKREKILITGGLGFIGSNLAIKLVGLGAKVTILDALTPGYGGNKFNIFPIKNRVKVTIGDMRNHATIKQAVMDNRVIAMG